MPRRVAMLMFDNVEVMDFAGPFEVFGISGQREGKNLFDVYTVARESKPVMARNNLSINPGYSFRDCPKADILVVPGGPGARREAHNPSVLDFIREHTEQAERFLQRPAYFMAYTLRRIEARTLTSVATPRRRKS